MRNLLLLSVLMACTTADQSALTSTVPPTPAAPALQPQAALPETATLPPVLASAPRPSPRPDPEPNSRPSASASASASVSPTPTPIPIPIPVAVTTPIASPATARANTPDILVLGDSQISFGAGAEYLKFFRDLPQRCGANAQQTEQLAALGQRTTAAIGVRSTSLASWTARDGSAKGTICDVDERFGVNAGAYGIQGNDNRAFVQIGRGEDYQFCEPEKSPFEAAFTPGNYDPKLLVLAFLGNSEARWANNPTAAAQDAQRTISQIPSDIPCVFLTTVPVFEEETNDARMQAQTAIINAFEQSGGHCEPVAGFTRQTRNAIEGQLDFFRQRDDGSLADPFHPRPAATRLFLDLNAPQLCDAVLSALGNP